MLPHFGGQFSEDALFCLHLLRCLPPGRPRAGWRTDFLNAADLHIAPIPRACGGGIWCTQRVGVFPKVRGWATRHGSSWRLLVGWLFRRLVAGCVVGKFIHGWSPLN